MSENLGTSLLITLIGMTLVFSAIVLLWGMMAALVRLASEGKRSEAHTELVDLTASESDERELELARRAAAAAVAIAVARQAAGGPKPFPLPPTALVSTWQAVMRSRLLGQRDTMR
jgi:Na+-transporting methylmalonyl-CoA/oxaloacetate decarboxylase gamma subunit